MEYKKTLWCNWNIESTLRFSLSGKEHMWVEVLKESERSVDERKTVDSAKRKSKSERKKKAVAAVNLYRNQ